MMADIISVLVVLVFVLIVFRKRLAPLFRGRKHEESEAPEEKDGEETGPVHDYKGNVYVNVCAIDTSIYSSMHDLSHAIEDLLFGQMDWIYNNYIGGFVGLDYITVDTKLIFLIRWHT